MPKTMSVRRNRILRWFFISFIVVTLIPVTFLSVVYSHFLDTLRSEVRSRNETILAQSQQAIDGILVNAQNLTGTFGFNFNAQQFAYKRFDYSSPIMAGYVRELLQSISVNRQLISQANMIELGIYAAESGAVVSKLAGYARSSEYFHNSVVFRDRDMMQYLQKPNRFQIHKNSKISVFGKVQDVLIITSPIFSSNAKIIDAASIFAFVDAEKIRDELEMVLLSEKCFAYIADREGNILLHTGNSVSASYDRANDIKLNPAQFIILQKTGTAGFTYTAYISSDSIYQGVTAIRGVILLVISISLAAGILVSFLLARKNSKPIMDIYHLVQDETEQQADGPIWFDYLKGTIQDYIRQNAALSSKLSQNQAFLKRDLVRRIIDGSTFLPNEIESRAKTLGIDLSAHTYAALLVKPGYSTTDSEDLNNLSNAWILVEQAFNASSHFHPLFSLDKPSEISILLLMQGNSGDDLEQLLRDEVTNIDTKLRSDFNLPLQYICGGITDQISGLAELFMRTQSVSTLTAGEGLRFANPRDRKTPQISRLEETQLFNAVIAGESSQAKALMDKIWTDNLDAMQTSPRNALLFGNALHLALSRIAFELPEGESALQDAPFLIDGSFSGMEEDHLSAIHDLLLKLVGFSREKIQREESALYQSMMDYISNNYTDPGFSLSHVSAKFELPESAVYRYIRKISGQTFAALLEKMRMDKAREHFADERLTIDEIATMVGYNSAHAFRRAFKRFTGVLPTQYRKTL